MRWDSFFMDLRKDNLTSTFCVQISHDGSQSELVADSCNQTKTVHLTQKTVKGSFAEACSLVQVLAFFFFHHGSKGPLNLD